MALPVYNAVRFDRADEGVGKDVRRFDVGELSSPERTPDGFLRAQGITTRAGVFTYRRADGTSWNELRHPDEVFHPDSLKSLALLPVTNDHPPDNLTPATVKQHQVGQTGQPERVGNAIRADVLLTDAKAIADAENGKNGLSYGYRTRVFELGGTWTDDLGKAHRFDTYQTMIRGNHLALTSLGRAGDDARLRMDAADGAQRADHYWTCDDLPQDVKAAFVADLDAQRIWMEAFNRAYYADGNRNRTDDDLDKLGTSAAWAAIKAAGYSQNKTDGTWTKRADSARGEQRPMLKKITIGNHEYEVDEAVANQFASMQGRIDAQRSDGTDLVSLRREIEQLRGQLDAATADLRLRQDSEAQKTEREKQETALTGKLELLARAAPILGKPMKELVAMDAMTLMREVIAKESPDTKITGKPDAYIEGVFMHITNRVDTAAMLNRIVSDAKETGRKDAAARTDSSDLDKQMLEARKRMTDEMQDAWKPKPAPAPSA